MISVIIATLNREKKLINCINSILNNDYPSFEIIVVSQLKLFDPSSNNKKVRCFFTKDIGKSKALNFGIKKAKGNILAFTDDDCLVSKNWLSNIDLIFKKNQDCVGIFGKTLPSKNRVGSKTKLHKTCPCTSIFSNQQKFSKPTYHANIGFGNNMAYRKNELFEIGQFKNWLGPGSIGSNAEDADIVIRTLESNKIIIKTPKVIVYHDRWLNTQQQKIASRSYLCGEFSCYSYHMLNGEVIAKKQLILNTLQFKKQISTRVQSIINKNQNFITALFELKDLIIETMIIGVLLRIKGLCVGLFFFYLEKIER